MDVHTIPELLQNSFPSGYTRLDPQDSETLTFQAIGTKLMQRTHSSEISKTSSCMKRPQLLTLMIVLKRLDH